MKKPVEIRLIGVHLSSNFPAMFMPTVLITEDDPDNRNLLKVLLDLWNYRVVEAADSIDALNLACDILPDLILTDVKMPLLDGFETTRDNVRGLIPDYITEAGFRDVREIDFLNTSLGTFSYYRGIK